ncbi:glycosyltransferase [Desulforamulus aquiferis]|uniref:Glycosyltransferase n=2 Tax=Desulforamulus aquiferis TaxID=1397668 RepID=A0AAW7ZC87_9FIRM|nr:glycosyltransferase [Desulforamulus aquiferis]
MQKYDPVFVGRSVLGKAPEGAKVISLVGAGSYQIYKNVVFRNAKYFERLIKPLKPALIHAHFGVEGVYALELAKSLNTPLVTTFHGFDATITNKALLTSGKPSWVNYLIHRRKLAKEGQMFVCVSNYIRDRVLEMGFPEERTITHYIGIDTETIKPIKEITHVKIILHVARLVEKKGTEYLIKAFSKISTAKKNYQLVIIGEGPLRDELQSLACSLRINDRINFLGVQNHSEVIKWMGRASLFCLPSIVASSGDSEGLGMVFLEAAAMAVPAVATYHGGIPEVVKDGETGYLVKEKDINSLAECLRNLLENDGLCDRMGQAARKLVEREFNIRNQTAMLEELYKELS